MIHIYIYKSTSSILQIKFFIENNKKKRKKRNLLNRIINLVKKCYQTKKHLKGVKTRKKSVSKVLRKLQRYRNT